MRGAARDVAGQGPLTSIPFGNANQDSTIPGATDQPTPTDRPAPTDQPAPTAKPDPAFGQPVAKIVPRAEEATLGSGITGRIVALTPVEAKATRAGEVGGPAVQVDIELTNVSPTDLSLDGVTVNGYYGADKTPASPIVAQSGQGSFDGVLAAGATAKGRYVFSVPADQRDAVIITVSPAAGAALVVFK
jgi:hypothetical protein